MHQLLVANALLELSAPDGTKSIQRVLWVDPPSDEAVVITLPADHEMPQTVTWSGLVQALQCGEARVLQHDPYLSRGSTDALSKENRMRLDKAWKSIQALLSLGETAPFDVRQRSQWINSQTGQRLYSKPYLYRLLRRYWQGGQTPQALLPQYHRCGAPGKERTSTSSVKRGRAQEPSVTHARPLGIKVDERIKQLLQQGGEMFYESKEKFTLREAYNRTIEHFFNIGYDAAPSGVLVPVLPEEGERPSYDQFRYWYGKRKRVVEAQLARNGEREYQLKSRMTLGNATKHAYGPGSEYQVDWTMLDINLVSRIARTHLLGRPLLYVVKDTFSRMVVGFYVTFEHFSARTALLAFENVAANKEAFCRTLGIAGVTTHVWPTAHFPASLIADRGEFIGTKFDAFVTEFNVRVSNTPPYRPDWKPFVERHFGLINTRVVRKLPGATQKSTRGSRDSRLDAVLDLPALKKILALDFIDYNTTAVLTNYPIDADMAADNVKPRPIDLWNWGLSHRTGAQKSFSQDKIRRFLMPEESASVTQYGLRVKDLYFTADILVRLNWFSQARIRGTTTRTVSYDPLANADTVYLHASYADDPELRESMTNIVDGIGLIACQVISHRRFEANVSWYEHELELDRRKKQEKQAIQEQAHERQITRAEINAIVEEQKAATAVARQNQDVGSNRARIKKIPENREEERALERAELSSPGGQALPTSKTNTARATPRPSAFDPSTTNALDEAMASARARRQRKDEP